MMNKDTYFLFCCDRQLRVWPLLNFDTDAAPVPVFVMSSLLSCTLYNLAHRNFNHTKWHCFWTTAHTQSAKHGIKSSAFIYFYIKTTGWIRTQSVALLVIRLRKDGIFRSCVNKTWQTLTMNGLLDIPGPAIGCPKGVMEGLFWP